MSARVHIVSADPPLIAVDGHSPHAKALWLTADEARALSVQLADAADEIELAQGAESSRAES